MPDQGCTLPKRWFLDTDISVSGGDFIGEDGVTLGLRPRVKVGFAFTEHLALAAGPSLNVGPVELGYGDEVITPPVPSAPGREGGFQTLWGTDIWPGASRSVNWF